MIIPTEARATLAAIREGLTEREYIDAIWARRVATQPSKKRPRWKFPLLQPATKPSNVTAIRKART